MRKKNIKKENFDQKSAKGALPITGAEEVITIATLAATRTIAPLAGAAAGFVTSCGAPSDLVADSSPQQVQLFKCHSP